MLICFCYVSMAIKPWPKDQTLLVKHSGFALHAVFDSLATSQTLPDKRNRLAMFSGYKHKMFDEQCFSTWPTGQHFV